MTTKLKMFFFAVVLVASATSTHAAINQGGSGGMNFSCDVNTGSCKCSGVGEGADCQAMKKNCKDGKYSACHDEPGDKWCICSMYKQANTTPKIERAPAAPARQ